MTRYIGRFAPTPSGPVHLGTLLAAIGSFLQARSQQGLWHVRIDDIDPPREVAGAADSILRTLERYGLYWDGPVVYQSQRLDGYQAALDQLVEQEDVFSCACSRKDIEQVARSGPNGAIYPGTCRNGLGCGQQARAIRLRTEEISITVKDLVQGKFTLDIQNDVGDYVLRRADGLFAYHLATVVDDGLDGYTEIVRGQDLLSITPQQIYLQQRLGIPTPKYAHLPLLFGENGKKFSKRSGAQPVDDMPQCDVYRLMLETLGLKPPESLDLSNPEEALGWAIESWDLSAVPAKDRIA